MVRRRASDVGTANDDGFLAYGTGKFGWTVEFGHVAYIWDNRTFKEILPSKSCQHTLDASFMDLANGTSLAPRRDPTFQTVHLMGTWQPAPSWSYMHDRLHVVNFTV